MPFKVAKWKTPQPFVVTPCSGVTCKRLNEMKHQIRPNRYYNSPKQFCGPLKRKAWSGPRGLWPFMFDVALVLMMAPRGAEFCLEGWENGRGGGRERLSYAVVNYWQSLRQGRSWWWWRWRGGQNRGATGKGAHNKVWNEEREKVLHTSEACAKRKARRPHRCSNHPRQLFLFFERRSFIPEPKMSAQEVWWGKEWS